MAAVRSPSLPRLGQRRGPEDGGKRGRREGAGSDHSPLRPRGVTYCYSHFTDGETETARAGGQPADRDPASQPLGPVASGCTRDGPHPLPGGRPVRFGQLGLNYMKTSQTETGWISDLRGNCYVSDNRGRGVVETRPLGQLHAPRTHGGRTGDAVWRQNPRFCWGQVSTSPLPPLETQGPKPVLLTEGPQGHAGQPHILRTRLHSPATGVTGLAWAREGCGSGRSRRRNAQGGAEVRLNPNPKPNGAGDSTTP